MGNIKTFFDLDAWKEAHKLLLMTYNITEKFPAKELYVLVSQLRRAVISISSNIAEGFSRRGKKEKIQFYSTSLGSLTEIQNQFLIAKDLNYLDEMSYTKIEQQMFIVHKLINGLIKGVAKLY